MPLRLREAKALYSRAGLAKLFMSSCFPSYFSQDVLEYKKKQRPQKIKMLDGAVKTIMVDDSKTVGELLVTICSRIGECITVKKNSFILPYHFKMFKSWIL